MSTTRDSVEKVMTAIVPLPCGHHWWVYSPPTFALGGLAVAWFTGRSKFFGVVIGGLIGYLIHRYSQEIPFTAANQVSPALRTAATAAGEAARAAEDAQRVAQGLAPRWSTSAIASRPGILATQVVSRVPVSPVGAVQQIAEMRANSDLVAYCRGPYDVATHGNVSQHTQEYAAGGWREAIPAFRCFRAPSFNF